jgi:hypothetical protein
MTLLVSRTERDGPGQPTYPVSKQRTAGPTRRRGPTGYFATLR